MDSVHAAIEIVIVIFFTELQEANCSKTLSHVNSTVRPMPGEWRHQTTGAAINQMQAAGTLSAERIRLHLAGGSVIQTDETGASAYIGPGVQCDFKTALYSYGCCFGVRSLKPVLLFCGCHHVVNDRV
jgi:hypothetical protein